MDCEILAIGDYIRVYQNHPNAVRAYEIFEGDVVTVGGLTLQYEKPFLYEVEKYEMGGYIVWLRTGRTFTPQQLNARRANMEWLAKQEEREINL